MLSSMHPQSPCSRPLTPDWCTFAVYVVVKLA